MAASDVDVSDERLLELLNEEEALTQLKKEVRGLAVACEPQRP